MPIELHNADLSACEAVIEHGLRAWYEGGLALARIRDARLYLESHETFDEYCKTRWKWGRNYANKQIVAANVVGTMVPKGLPAPASERVARELAKADEPETVWRTALKLEPDGPTAKTVREVHEQQLWNQLTKQAQEALGDQRASAAKLKKVLEAGKEAEPRKRAIAEKQVVSKLFGGSSAAANDAPPTESDDEPDPPPVVDVCQGAEPEPSSARRPITVPPPEPEEDAPSASLQSVADAWNEMTSVEQDDFLGAVGAVRFATLEALAEQRARNTAYSVRRESMATGSDGARMIAAVLDGADWALARLGLTWSSTEAEAKRAFKQASLQAHPDRGGTDEEFTAISRANAIVMRWLQGKAA